MAGLTPVGSTQRIHRVDSISACILIALKHAFRFRVGYDQRYIPGLDSAAVLSRSAVHGASQSYRVKPHGQLVLVSLTHYCASTPSLSTSWSTTTLQGAQGPGRSHLGTSFPLRCFQRLSLPHIATRRCHWRDNRYTRGVSTPVLSY